MTQSIFFFLDALNNALWSHVAFLLIIGLGFYFSVRSRFFQVRRFGSIVASFCQFFGERKTGTGIHPLKAFFAAIGGCIGIGNVVGICTAVQIGGPGAMFWTWVGGLMGMLIQYAEVYLGLKYRVANRQGSYDGGPMYFLPKAFRNRWIAPTVCILLGIYGVEIFMFNVMADSISTNWNIPEIWVVAVLLAATLLVALGGINRVGEVCSAIIPLFILLYMGMGIWVLFTHRSLLPEAIGAIFRGALTPQAPLGAFAGSGIAQTISMGLSRGAYSGDIGVGYTSIIYAEARTNQLQRQSSMTILAVFIDTFVICTMSILLILATGMWKEPIDSSQVVQQALSTSFPYMNFFMPFFLFLLGYTTILAYFVVGVKCAKFLSPKWGPLVYYGYACFALPFFAFFESTQAFVIMSLSGFFLLALNLAGIFVLRKQVDFPP